MVPVLLGFGSNLGDRLSHLQEALRRLENRAPEITVERVASVRETEPVGPAQGPFLNSAVLVSTSLTVQALLKELKAIERACGRSEPVIEWGPREIDIDLLLYGDNCTDSEALTVPHDQLHRRRFVLEPCAELAASWTHPRLGKTLGALLEAYAGEEPPGAVVAVPEAWYPQKSGL